MSEIKATGAPEAVGPYVQGVDLGFMIITSGQLPINPETKKMSDDVAEQCIQSLNNAVAIIKEAGSDVNKIVKTMVFVKDLNDFSVVNEAYNDFFKAHNAPFPARSCVEVARLPMDAKIEIEVIAIK